MNTTKQSTHIHRITWPTPTKAIVKRVVAEARDQLIAVPVKPAQTAHER